MPSWNEHKQSIMSGPYLPAFARSDFKGPGLFLSVPGCWAFRSYFKNEEVLCGWPSLTVEKAADALYFGGR
jgi:hypothetical protein